MDDFNSRQGNEEEQNVGNGTENTENAPVSQNETEHVTAEQVNQQSSFESQQGQFNTSYQYARPQNPYTTNQTYAQNTYVEAKPKKKKGKVILIAVLAALVVFLSTCLVVTIFKKNNNSKNNAYVDGTTNSNVPTIATDSNAGSKISHDAVAPGVELSSVQVADKVSPSIVGVLVYKEGSDTLSNEGTGFIFQEDSAGKYTYILTCAHVVSGSGLNVRVQFKDESQLAAEVVGYDSRTDVGVIRVEKAGLACATLGSSENLSVGQQVFAVGNPGGTSFFGSFTGGMISAIDRIVETEYAMECIQHDAAISPGNSGGPLVDTFGNVVGINSSKIYTSDGSYEGMGFAIPMSSYIKDVINKLMVYGYVPGRAKLGITYAPVSAHQTYSMIVQIKELPAGSIIVSAISSDSDLIDKDVQKGDMIIAANGKEFEKSSDLIELIESSSVGDKITLTICRIKSNDNFSTTQFDVTIELVEDKGTTVIEEETTTSLQNPFYFPY